MGMGRDVVACSPRAAEIFKQANEVLGFDLQTLCFEGPAEKLEQTDVQQPAILVTSLALWAALSEAGADLSMTCTAGLSLGEYTALHVAGAIEFEDAVRLVHRRGQYMQEAAVASVSGMVSVLGIEPDDVTALCAEAAEGQVLVPANFNCPGQIVVSGETEACDRLVAIVESGRGKAIKLKVAGAFHSPLMQPAADRLKADLASTTFSTPLTPVIANVDATAHVDADCIRQRLFEQVFSPVRWQSSVEGMIGDGIEEFVEVGPGRSLTGMMRKIDRKKKAVNISTAETLEQFASLSVN